MSFYAHNRFLQSTFDNTVAQYGEESTGSSSTLHAIVNGLTGGDPIQDAQLVTLIKPRPPNSKDDTTENWNMNSLWTDSDGNS